MSEKGSYISKFSTFFDLTRFPRVVWKNRSLVLQFTVRNITSRYRGSFLGLLWSLIQPLLMLVVYTFVFSVALQARWGMHGVQTVASAHPKCEYAIIMFCGMAVYTIFAESVTMSVTSVTGNVNLVKKVIFPLEILPLAQVISSTILSLLWFLLLLLGVVLVFGKLSLTILLLPLILLPLGCLSLGISYFVASVGVFVRDMQHIVGVIMQVLLFMTPIFYPVENLPEQYRWPLKLNPLGYLVEACRRILIFGKTPGDIYLGWVKLGIVAAFGLLVLHLGFFWFCKTKKGFADVL